MLPHIILLQVRCCYGDSGDWWYDHGAVRPIHMKYVPESLRAAVRPRWGDYVALTHEHGAFGTAADGPLEPGNLGVVVAVHDLPDSKGGLVRPRYTVRACHNGQACRWVALFTTYQKLRCLHKRLRVCKRLLLFNDVIQSCHTAPATCPGAGLMMLYHSYIIIVLCFANLNIYRSFQ